MSGRKILTSEGMGRKRRVSEALVSPPDQTRKMDRSKDFGESMMIKQKYRILCLFFVVSFIILLTGCNGYRQNTQYTVRLSGDTKGLPYEGQCTVQRARFLSGKSTAQGLDMKGTIDAESQEQDYQMSGYFIYCAVANQSTTGIIKVELLRNNEVVASAQSTAPDKPAILEFGQKP